MVCLALKRMTNKRLSGFLSQPTKAILKQFYKLYIWYYAGLCGLEENEPKALELLTAASEGGYLEAQLRLAEWYKDGIVVSQDPKKAFQLYKSASDAGSNEAKVELAFCYADGFGIKQNKKTAFSLITDAAEGGSITGQRLVGVYYSQVQLAPKKTWTML